MAKAAALGARHELVPTAGDAVKWQDRELLLHLRLRNRSAEGRSGHGPREVQRLCPTVRQVREPDSQVATSPRIGDWQRSVAASGRSAAPRYRPLLLPRYRVARLPHSA